MSKMLVTGAAGFVGRHVAAHLAAAGLHVVGTSHRHSGNAEGVIRNPGKPGKSLDSGSRPLRGLARNDGGGTSLGSESERGVRGQSRKGGVGVRVGPPPSDSDPKLEWRRLELADPGADLDAVCRGVETVVHLAARVHVGPAGRLFNGRRFHGVNAAGTERLAQAAIRQGVRHFIYLSSVGVHGAESPAGAAGIHRFDESDTPAPHNDYARSKLEGENRLRAACSDSAMSFTLLRAPLVFGPGVGANFRALLRAIMIGLPLPLQGVRAQRSVIYVEHLAEIILRCIEAPAARNALFLVSDHDHEIEALVRSLAEALQRPARLWHCPDALAGILSRKPVLGDYWRSLTRSLLVNSARVREALNWSPSIAPDEALRRTVAAYRGSS